MSDLLTDLEALLDPTSGKTQRPRAEHRGPTAPAASPQMTGELEEFDGSQGYLKVNGNVPVEDWRSILRVALAPEWGLDPEELMLLSEPRVTSHVVFNGETGEWENKQAWWKIQFGKAELAQGHDEDAERLIRDLTEFKLPATADMLTGDDYFVLNVGDWQMGQQDDGGTKHTVSKLDAIFTNVAQRVRALRAAGRPLGTCVIGSGGDLFEGCKGFYPMQAFTVDLDRRQQGKVTRRVLVKLIKYLAELGFKRFIFVVVPGNHGENRDETGKAFTSWGDNDDVAVWESVYDVISETRLADLCEWVIPTDDLTVTTRLAGRTVGWNHGHQCRTSAGGGDVVAKVWKWFEQQALGRSPAGDCDIFNVFHFHHFYAKENASRLLIGNPAACGSSRWWHELSGQGSVPGQLTYVITEDSDAYFEDLEIVRP